MRTKGLQYIQESTRTYLNWRLLSDKALNLDKRKVEICFHTKDREPVEANFTVNCNSVRILIPSSNELQQDKYTLCMMIDKNLETEQFCVLLDAFQVVPFGSAKCPKEIQFTSKLNYK